MGHVEDFQRELTVVMENLLHSAVTKTTRLFETTVHAMKAELVGIRKQNDAVEDVFGLERNICNKNLRTRDIGVQCIVTPTQTERSQEDTGGQSQMPELPRGSVTDDKQQLILLCIKPEEEEDMYDLVDPKPSVTAGQSKLSSPGNHTTPPHSPLQHGQWLDGSSPVESITSSNANTIDGLPSEREQDIYGTPQWKLLSPTSSRTWPWEVEHGIGVKEEPEPCEIYEFSFGLQQPKMPDQPKRTITRPSTSIYRRPPITDTPQQTSELQNNRTPPNATSASPKQQRPPIVDTPQQNSENTHQTPNNTSASISTCSVTPKQHGKAEGQKVHKQANGAEAELSETPRGAADHKCPVCGFVANSASLLQHHWKVHRSQKDWVCYKCGKICPNERSFTCHMLLHTYPTGKRHVLSQSQRRSEDRSSQGAEDNQSPEPQQKAAQEQPRRLSARTSRSVYRRLAVLETEHDAMTDDLGTPTDHADTKPHSDTNESGSEQLSSQSERSGSEELSRSQSEKTHGEKSSQENQCEVCGLVVNNALSLRQHWKVHRSGRDCVCQKCGKICPNERSLTCHLLWHTYVDSKRRSEAAPCRKAERADSTMEKPCTGSATVENTAKEQSRRLSERMSKSEYRHRVISHMTQPTAGTSPTPTTLKPSSPPHNPASQYTCEVCSGAFPSLAALEQHQMHHRDTAYPCGWCGRLFATEEAMTSHVRTHAENKSCGRTPAADKPAATGLTRVHSSKKRYQCDRCDKSFLYRYSLTRHLVAHGIKRNAANAADKSLPCNICGKRLSNKKSLAVHRRLHLSQLVEKPFTCSLCSRPFQHRKSLVAHMRTHTGEKPFSCHTCGKRFQYSKSLTVHNRLHTGDMPYQCTSCGKRFRQSSNLICHNKKYHAGEKGL